MISLDDVVSIEFHERESPYAVVTMSNRREYTMHIDDAKLLTRALAIHHVDASGPTIPQSEKSD